MSSSNTKKKKKIFPQTSSSKRIYKQTNIKSALMNSKLSDTIQTLYQINTDTSKKTKDKNMSLFKKYLNPWNKTNLISPTKIKGMIIFVWLLCNTDFMLKLINVQIFIIPFQL